MNIPPLFPPTIGIKLPSEMANAEFELVDAEKGKGAELGEGGRGTAFLARVNGGEDCGGRRVIKFPRIDLNNYTMEQTKRRVNEIHDGLLSEMQVSLELEDIYNVTPILELHGGPWRLDTPGYPLINLFYTVYQYVEGSNLFHWCVHNFPSSNPKAGGKFWGIADPEQWFSLARKLLAKLDEVHCRRVVHADIWPDNIMMSQDGRPNIIDFGEAWSMSYQLDSMSCRDAGHEYLAPERRGIATESGRWYTTADVYSMGGCALLFGNWPGAFVPISIGYKSLYAWTRP